MSKENMIYIIGAGAIGKALAVFLRLQGRRVILLRGSVDDVDDYIEKIRVRFNDREELEAEVKISTLSQHQKLEGIIVLTNKSYGNSSLSSLLKSRINGAPVIILQNGLDVEKPFIEKEFNSIYRCVLFATSQALPDKAYRFKPVSVSPIGIIRGNADELALIIEQLNNPFFAFAAEPDILPVIWVKTIVNSIFNSVCPLLETDNGIFHRETKALRIAERVIAECVAVARSSGILLETEKVVQTLLMISKSSDGQLISTYQDILNKRRTEIDTLNFAIVNQVTQLSERDMVKETLLLGDLVKLKSELNL